MEDLRSRVGIEIEEIFSDAINWLGVVGEYEHRIPKPDVEFNQSRDKALRFLGTKIATGDIPTADLLADLEREAQRTTSQSWITDEDMQIAHRANQFNELARVMNSYADYRTEA
jgi:hypothetical protein